MINFLAQGSEEVVGFGDLCYVFYSINIVGPYNLNFLYEVYYNIQLSVVLQHCGITALVNLPIFID